MKSDPPLKDSEFFLCCKSHVADLMAKKSKDMSDEDHIIHCLFENNSHPFTEEEALLWARLIKAYPTKYKINGAIVMSEVNGEEFEEDMLSLHE